MLKEFKDKLKYILMSIFVNPTIWNYGVGLVPAKKKKSPNTDQLNSFIDSE